ncbi:MAG: UpxY family transcription antiterminator [Ignavibacteria bacterium]|nr:UpxY family transcription antiterminator [Ignavibacteria bacterium]
MSIDQLFLQMIKNKNNGKNWFALYTKPRSEFKASQQLAGVEIEHYLPAVMKLKQWSDRKKKVTEPLIRGYIFIYANEHQRLASLEQPSIVRCIFDGGHPAAIPDWQIDNIRKMLSLKSEIIVHNGIVSGTIVKIKNGPFEGVVGIVTNNEMGKSISISIDILNRSVITKVPQGSELELIKEL